MTPLIIAGVLIFIALIALLFNTRMEEDRRRAEEAQAKMDRYAEEFNFQLRNRNMRPSPSNPNPNEVVNSISRGLSQAQITHGERVAERLKKNGRSS